MDTMPDDLDYVIVGVDTHADTHVAVVLSLLGEILGSRAFPATRAGYGRLVEWASSFGVIDRIGIEGTGSWGRGLTLFCLSRGLAVRDVDRPDRLHSEAAFANLCAAAPVPVNSGRSHRHRLNHGGHRQGNRALHTIVVSRIRWPDDRTRDYVTRRNPTGDFKADLDTIRRLKRYVAREVFPLIVDALTQPTENLAPAA